MLPRSRPAAHRICWRYVLSRIPRPHPSSLPLRQIPLHLHQSRLHATVTTAPLPELSRTRNIGIIAHIDAGKTTTTERMLYYSGFTRRIGEVDEGSTVMDFLPAERARGITITSAAITFNWNRPGLPAHTINLIDTPGHADFTFEVERAIRVLDGAVTILDGVAGVEAQTEKVWRQAAKHNIPRIIFVNKLDRVGARFGAIVREVAGKLNAWPAVLQLPLYEADGRGGEDVLRGVVDIVERRVYVYSEGGDGRDITAHDYDWLEKTHPQVHSEALAGRTAIVELLAEHDDGLVEEYLELSDYDLLPAASIKRALRKTVLSPGSQITPILCGASFRNIGVQPLLDAVVDYLPSPVDLPPTDIIYGPRSEHRAILDPATSLNRVCALAFKVVHDPRRGPMVYVRVYSGTLTRAQNLHNTSLNVKERAHRLLQMFADNAVDIDAIPAGHIGVIIGLKSARTGDTLVSEHQSGSSSPSPKKRPTAASEQKVDYKTLQLRPIDVPSPVFFASLEPYSLSDEKQLGTSLEILLREDPSLKVTIDPDSGQTLLSGMGGLHLEIARDRLVNELKARADMGKILIAYRESIAMSSTAGDPSGLVKASIHPIFDTGQTRAEDSQIDDSNFLSLPHPLPSPSSLLQTTEVIASSLTSGVTAALSRGPHLALPLHSIAVNLSFSTPNLPVDASPASLSAAAREAVSAALSSVPEESRTFVEPLMKLTITLPASDVGKVTNDISGARGGQVLQLLHDEEAEQVGMVLQTGKVWVPQIGTVGGVGGRDKGEGRAVVVARMGLKEGIDWLKVLRGLTAGRGQAVMDIEGWEVVVGKRAEEAKRGIRGW